MAPTEIQDVEDLATFAESLRSLHEISLELAASHDAEALCRRAVEWGIVRLGFDRLSLWFIDPLDAGWNIGTWGTDEEGRLRDERGKRVKRDAVIAPPEFYDGKVPVLVSRDAVCYDDTRREVGRSDTALAPLWDGKGIIGEMSVDNLFSRRSIGPRALDLLTIYARTVAHLYSLLTAKESLAAASEARRVLLGELKHRTKNSLSVIAGLIGLEAERATTAESRTILHSLMDRVGAFGTLYGLLELDSGGSKVDLDSYLPAVAAGLAQGHGADSRGIVLNVDIEAISVDARIAAPLGIALGELLTDSLKYAFPAKARGRIDLSLHREGDEATLVVADDGIGLPPGFTLKDSGGLGLGIVSMLARQLGGRLEMRSESGARFVLSFPLRRDGE